ncbi:MAG: hypothetical protein FWG67_02960 [Defluviitaleaceae bacterium]|nr:hypothetical protein [Defluviitaleaceae bacterium]
MQHLLGEKLAVIEFDFLEKMHLIEAWIDDFFEIFKWLDAVEDEGLYDEHLHVTLLNANQMFLKERGEQKVQIYENRLAIKPEEKNSSLLFFQQEMLLISQLENESDLLKYF